MGPVPPAELAGYIVGLEASDGVVAAYRRQGAELREAIVRELGGVWPSDGARALDFGCGSGRVLRQFAATVAPGQLVGCDIDEPCVAWVRDHLDGVEAVLTGEAPPLPFDDATFDVAWSMSVFSHLTDRWAQWLLELRRVVRPGGRLLISVAGGGASQQLAGEDWDPDRIGMTVRGPGRPWRAGGPMVLHSEWWIRAHWGRAFDVVAFEAGGLAGQDLVLLERPSTPAPSAADLQAPEPGEPRELTAALHAVALAHREHLELNRQHDAYAEAYVAEMATTAELRERIAALEQQVARGAGRRGLLRR
ncbi:tRNA methyltransferase [Baekduia alba]|nr:tRNA methyltransferase [Baekduia alba]